MFTLSKWKYILCVTSSHKFLFPKKLSCLGLWDEDLNTEIKLKIEKFWSKEAMLEHKNKSCYGSYYVLPMFPYPSGNLHMGHVRVYSISDTIARFQKLTGKNVIHPMGWDAFGLPAENAALERNIPPHHWTTCNIETMKKQLLQLGFNFDWSKEVSTCDPQYYKWTQYIFIKLFENGLAYQNKALVNWDPVDKTVLADEQVDDQGCSWRSGAKVEKKVLTQWFIRTTKFAKKLYDGLDSDILENWKDIINLQKHWIGECDGVSLNFKLIVQNQEKPIDVWTSDPYKFIHGQFLTMGNSNVIIQDLTKTEKDNLKAFNPVTNSLIPVFVTDNGNYSEGRDVNLICPAIDENDRKIALSLNIGIEDKNETMKLEEENKRGTDMALSKGGQFVSSKLKDWLISRQRYWGTPIPIIHCPNCGAVPVPYEDLPVKLPQSSESGANSLSKLDNWVNCKCPKCVSSALRETDTMDTFVDSSWYYYRFLDPNNDKMPLDKEKLVGNAPVDMYIGGKEHAVLHLYYARFMSYFLHSLGWTPTEEPFKKLLVQGMVMGQSYKVKSSGKYIPRENVEKIGNDFKEKSTSESVTVQWEKMSKSKYNGENPENLLSTYGCDTTRLLILADVPPATSRHWSDSTFPGTLNWQKRIWLTMREFLKHRNNISLLNYNPLTEELNNYESKLWESKNYFIATTTYHFRDTQMLSVGISRLQGLTNILRSKIPPKVVARSREYESALAALIIMLAPVTPHFCSELWAGFLSAPNRISESSSFFDWDRNVFGQKWPKVDDDYQLSFLCKVDGADRCELKIKATDLNKLSEEDALKLMTKQVAVAKRIKKGIKKFDFNLYPDCRAILHIFTARKEDVQKKELNSVVQ